MLARGLLAAIGWISVAHADLVPGLPVYSMDGSVVISQTVLNIDPELIPYPSGTRPENLPGAANLTVDGLGQVWASWSVQEHLDEDYWIESFFINQISQEEPNIFNLRSDIPFSWGAYRFAADTDQTWCAVREELISSPDLIRVFPCDSPESDQVLETDSSPWTWDLLILDGEPVIIEEQVEGELQARHVLSGQIKEIPFSWPIAPFSLDIPLQSTSIGSAPVILSSGVIYPPHSGGSAESYSVLSVLQDQHWRSDAVLRHFSPFYRISPGYNLATDIGSDGGSLVYMAFVQDVFSQPSDREEFYPPFDVSWRPKIRVFQGTALDTIEEWTLGYSETVETVEEDLAPHSFIAVTSGHERVGFAVIHAGNLDLWVLKGQFWFGPYEVDPNVDGPSDSPSQEPVDIAVDGKGRYWISWMKSGTPYLARLTPEDLGLESGTATNIRTEDGPQRPVLAQNFPNPFNAQTTIEVVTASEKELDIFDLMGQRIRSIPTGPGVNRVVWDGSDDSGHPAASGVYLYRLRDSSGPWSFKRMALIR